MAKALGYNVAILRQESPDTMKNFSLMIGAVCGCLLAVLPVQAADQDLQVLASVHPLGLVAASVVPEAQLQVLLPLGMTPHDFSLKPSDIERIRQADVVLWSGAVAEPYLSGFVGRWPQQVWIDASAGQQPAADVTHAAAHDDHEHNDHDHSAHQPDEQHNDHEPAGQEQHAHHHDGFADPHWWLNPQRMIHTQQQLAAALQQDASPFAAAVTQQLAASARVLEPLQDRGFFVFHRAWDHWVEQFGLNQVGAFTLSPEYKPGARTLQSMRAQLQRGEVVCVFSEPEFSPALVDAVVKGLAVKRAELDPLAQHIPLGADGYVRYLADLTGRFATCLKP
ncbi:hypothetical protein GJQ54_00355 [Oceanospirillaceae bacterium ASx5O]|nr:hypothetical protein GJQ54_00355 [Oceanospirillaceae bacterium ASx5O]